MLAIYKRELKSYFQSMVGCVFIAFLMVFTGIYFMAYNLTAGYPYFSYTLSGSLIVFIVGIPLITMRSFSEERKNKTDQLLLTAPVSLGKVVMGRRDSPQDNPTPVASPGNFRKALCLSSLPV